MLGSEGVSPRAALPHRDPMTDSPTPADSAYARPECVFCGGSACPVALAQPKFVVRRCPSCTVMWCDPTRFDQSFNPDNEEAYLETQRELDEENVTRLELLQQIAPASSHPRLLELGCMHGDFVKLASEAGYSCEGLDLSETAVKTAARVAPGMVRLGTVDGEIPTGSLDVIAAFNVIEHMDDPHVFLDHASRALRPGGVLILETPRQESLFHHIMFAQGRLRGSGTSSGIGVHPGTHIFKFGNQAWRKILARRGFEVVTLEGKSTPLRQLFAKRDRPLHERVAIRSFDTLARLTGLENRLILIARRRPDADDSAA